MKQSETFLCRSVISANKHACGNRLHFEILFPLDSRTEIKLIHEKKRSLPFLNFTALTELLFAWIGDIPFHLRNI